MTIARITENHIYRALDHNHPYFITTQLYWDCECDAIYIHPRELTTCEKCGALQEDSPDARINEVNAAGIHTGWNNPEVIATMDEHNTEWRNSPAHTL